MLNLSAVPMQEGIFKALVVHEEEERKLALKKSKAVAGSGHTEFIHIALEIERLQ